MADEQKLSAVEGFKTASNFLRGDIAKELADNQPGFGKGSVQLLKNHGTYQQDDRDNRVAGEGPKGKSGREISFMVRSKIPGGKLTSSQLLAELDLGDEVGNQSLRITSRQGLQIHGVVKSDLKKTIQRINDVQLSTLADCGDVERNVMCCPAPYKNDLVHQELQELADRLAVHLCPRTRAYHEIWLRDPDTNEEHLVGGGEPEVIEPIYGPTYLPRKFKTAIGLPGDNCVDLYANDLGLLAICRDWKIYGYNVLVGGGLGVTPSAKKTFPALAKRMAFVTPDQAVDVATAVIKVQRDFGNRADRKIARMKYLIADWGLEKFRAKVEEYYGRPLADPDPEDVWGYEDHLGWHEQGDGKWYLGLNVENGRIEDTPTVRLKTALRELCGRFAPPLRLTAHQSILFCDIREADREGIEQSLVAHGVKLVHEISQARRWSMACVALPTCGLAITESERALPQVIDQLDVELARLGLSDEVFTLRMTGCPNGCARPYNSDVGLVGKTADKYTIYLGGRRLGDRLNFVYKDLVPTDEIVPTLVQVLIAFKHHRQEGETLGDFCHRKGLNELQAMVGAVESSSR